jgi:hypothetical protein
VPVRHHVGAVVLTRHDDAVIVRQVLECDGVRDVPNFFEEGIPERETHPLANLDVGPIGPVGQCEGIERRVREPVDVEVPNRFGATCARSSSACFSVTMGSRGIPFANSSDHARTQMATSVRPVRAHCSSMVRRPTWAKGHQTSAKTSITGPVVALMLPPLLMVCQPDSLPCI